MTEMDYRREIKEALYAGQETLRYLRQAKDCLDSAGNWGIVDMLGGGMFITLIKRSRMKDADALVQQAHEALSERADGCGGYTGVPYRDRRLPHVRGLLL